jgi:hypothetical protein
METGFYSMTHEEYHKEQAVSKSDLTLFARSPAHYKAKEERKETPAMTFGEAVHTAILQPEVYIQKYYFLPEGQDGRTKEGKAHILKAQEEGKTPLSWADSGRIGEMQSVIRKHKSASRLIYAEGPAEISGFWIDKRTGLECRLRADKIRSDMNLVIDLKTTEDARYAAFQRTIVNYKYHWQASYYLTGISEITGIPHTNFVIVAIEKEPPYAVAVYRLDEALVYVGGEEIKVLMNEFREYKERDEWPAYPDDIQAISMPEWYLRRAEI